MDLGADFRDFFFFFQAERKREMLEREREKAHILKEKQVLYTI
jgi:hypothetical protein